MNYVPILADHPAVMAAAEKLNSAKAKRNAAEALFNGLCLQTNARSAIELAEDSIVAGTDPGFIMPSSGGEKEQVHLQLVAFSRAIPKLEHELNVAKATARAEIIDTAGLQAKHNEWLQSFYDAAKSFGSAAADLEDFYGSLETAEIGGSSCGGHFGWPVHPGRADNLNSPIAVWRRDVETYGFTIKE